MTFYFVREVIEDEARRLGVSVKDILSKDRRPHIIYARQRAMWRARKELNKSFPIIARAFKVDHTTVLYAYRKLEMLNGQLEKTPSAVALAQAIAAGEKTYIGASCRNGHDGLRRVSNNRCIACEAEYNITRRKPKNANSGNPRGAHGNVETDRASCLGVGAPQAEKPSRSNLYANDADPCSQNPRLSCEASNGETGRDRRKAQRQHRQSVGSAGGQKSLKQIESEQTNARILKLIKQGLGPQEISQRMGLAPNTISHRIIKLRAAHPEIPSPQVLSMRSMNR